MGVKQCYQKMCMCVWVCMPWRVWGDVSMCMHIWVYSNRVWCMNSLHGSLRTKNLSSSSKKKKTWQSRMSVRGRWNVLQNIHVVPKTKGKWLLADWTRSSVGRIWCWTNHTDTVANDNKYPMVVVTGKGPMKSMAIRSKGSPAGVWILYTNVSYPGQPFSSQSFRWLSDQAKFHQDWGPDLCESRRRAHSPIGVPSNVHINILRGLLCRLDRLHLKFTNEPSVFL